MKNMCIYHGNCADGFGAAWAVRTQFLARREEIEFYPGVYQNPPPDVTDYHVYLVDFSYKRDVLMEMAEKAHTITVIDHHKTAKEDLQPPYPPNFKVVFDMYRSGVMMTWQYFFGDVQPPKLIEHIQDRDLWQFKLPKTREIQAAVFSYPYDFDVWDRLMNMPLEELAREGEVIERKHFKDINELLGVTTRVFVIGGCEMEIANLPYTMTSDAGHILAKRSSFGAGVVIGIPLKGVYLALDQLMKV